MKKKYEEPVIEETEEIFPEEIQPVSEPVIEESGIWVYVGPNVRGIVTNGGIYFGTKKSVLESLPEGRKNYPKIERLIVSDKEVARAKELISEGKGGISVAYNAIAAEILNAAKEV